MKFDEDWLFCGLKEDDRLEIVRSELEFKQQANISGFKMDDEGTLSIHILIKGAPILFSYATSGLVDVE